MNPNTIKAARYLIGWSQDDLAKISGLTITTISNIEQSKKKSRLSTFDKIRYAFTSNGFIIIDKVDGSTIGVILERNFANGEATNE